MRSRRTGTRREASYFVTAFTACVLTLVSREALAIVRPRCGDVRMYATPLPIDAGGAAVLVVPNEHSTSFQVRWFAPDGTEILHDLSTTAGAFYLRPRVAVTPGVHTLNYTDDCDPVDPGRDFPLEFKSAPPPPERLGVLTVHYQKYCWNDGDGKLAPYFPPPVTVSLELDPAVLPYAARLQIHLKNDTGSLDSTFWAVEAPRLTSTLTPNCDSETTLGLGGGATFGPGQRTFVAEALLVDGAPLTPATASILLECPRCNGNGHMIDGGGAPPPEPRADASTEAPTPESTSTGSHDSGCSVKPSRAGSRHVPWPLLALGLAGFAAARRKKSPPDGGTGG
jgi:MYXO-CTERM domain-containing protein